MFIKWSGVIQIIKFSCKSLYSNELNKQYAISIIMEGTTLKSKNFKLFLYQRFIPAIAMKINVCQITPYLRLMDGKLAVTIYSASLRGPCKVWGWMGLDMTHQSPLTPNRHPGPSCESSLLGHTYCLCVEYNYKVRSFLLFNFIAIS